MKIEPLSMQEYFCKKMSMQDGLLQQAAVGVGRKGKDASRYMHVLTYLHCSYLPNDSRKEKKDIAELKIEGNI